MPRVRLPLFLALAALLLAPRAFAAERDASPFEFFQQENRASTALRRSEPAREAPAAVDVITAEDIRASGAVDLCDVMRYRTGLDVIDGRNESGGNRCVVSIRGMARDAVRELLVLIDGRSVYSPLGGTILWQQLPVQLQDIERIEIVRGPNAALYGSGAGLGVINIITKAPKDRLSASAAGAGGSLGSALSEESLGDARGRFSYRVSHAYRQQGGYPAVNGAPSNDFLHSQKGSARAVWRLSRDTSLDVYGGGSWDTFGQATGFGNAAGSSPQGRFRSHFETARLSHSLDEDDVLELDLTRNEQVSTISPEASGSPLSARYYEYQLEALQSFGYLDDAMHTTWGGSFRYTVADSADLFGTGTPLQVNRVIRGYVHQTARLSPKWTLIGGVSLESPYYLGTRHADYQAAALYQAAERHVVRASYSMAHTNPGFTDADSNFQQIPGVVFLLPNRSLKSYELQNYELGWQAEPVKDRLTLGSSLYYMKIRDHVNIENLNNQAGDTSGNPPLYFQYDNSNYLIARGMELEGKLALSPRRTAYANYSLETVSDRDSHTVYIKTTPKHIVNLGFDAALFDGLRASMNAGWKGGYLADSVSGTNQIWVNPFWRLDARLSYRPTRNLELFVSGLNLLTARHVEFVDGLTVPRKFYGGARLSF